MRELDGRNGGSMKIELLCRFGHSKFGLGWSLDEIECGFDEESRDIKGIVKMQNGS